jgi:hypothetical protein
VTPVRDALAVLLDALADHLASRILTAREREAYSSRHLPPRCSRRRFAELCRSGRILGAEREGRDWVCSRDAWEAARSRKAKRAVSAPGSPLSAQADALLARSGLRVVKGAR